MVRGTLEVSELNDGRDVVERVGVFRTVEDEGEACEECVFCDGAGSRSREVALEVLAFKFIVWDG